MNIVFICKFLLLISFLIFISCIIFRNYFSEVKLRSSYGNDSIEVQPIIFAKSANLTRRILLWNPFFDDRRWKLPKNTIGPDTFRDHLKCPITNCEITNDRAHLPSVAMFDAIVFHAVYDLEDIDALRSKRNVSQFYVFSNLESPLHTLQKLRYMQDFYNLTMTFRLDSDILWPYGRIVDITTGASVAPSIDPKWKSPPKPWHDAQIFKTFLRKVRSVAWCSSHCQTISQREYIVKELQEHIDVDIYGQCGTNSCDNVYGNCEFKKKLQSNYKFYLAFENTLCEDYVSEKVYMALENSVIPVVFGGANYTRFLPPHSYINVEDFESVAALGSYLHFVGSYADEYLRYFWWKAYYRLSRLSVFCSLCEFLHNQLDGTRAQAYKNITAWWRTAGSCRYESALRFNIKQVEKQLEKMMRH